MIAANVVLTLLVGAALGVVVWEHPPTAWGAMQVAGICLLGIGFVLWTTARFQLGRSLTVTAQAKQLVTRGLYSKIRNPIYVFGSCVIAGLILVLGRPVWVLAFLIVSVANMAGTKRIGCAGGVVRRRVPQVSRRDVVLKIGFLKSIREYLGGNHA